MAIGLNSVPLLSDSQNETPTQKSKRLDGNVKRLINLAVAKSVDRSLESEDAAVDADYKQNAKGLAAQAGDQNATAPAEDDMGNTVAGDHYENVTINMNQPGAQQAEQATPVSPLPTAAAAAPASGLPGWAKTALTIGGISLAGLAGYAVRPAATAPAFKDTDTNTGVIVSGGIPVKPTK